MERANRIISELDELFPNAKCELIHKNAFELIVAVSLSAQTTDERVNMVTPNLFEKYPTCYDLMNAELNDVEMIIKSIGLYHNKALNIIKMSKELVERFNGVVPSDMESLTSLPGVGRKTANVVMSVAFDIPAIAVDTHVERVSKRLGLAYKKDNVLTVEKKLMKKIKKVDWNRAHHLFIFFGRYMCKAKNPSCDICPFKDICKDYKLIK